MSFAYLQFYTGDYLRDTRGLSPMAHGVYLLLLFYQWDTRSPVPLDEQDAAGIANCRSQEEIECLRRILKRFFIEADDGHYSRRMQLEIEKAAALSAKRKYAGFKGFQAKAKHLPSKSIASAKQEPLTPAPTPYQHQNQHQEVKTTLSGSQANTDIARTILEFLNEKTGRQYRAKAVNLDLITARLKEGYTEREIRAVIARKCREWKGDDAMEKYLRPVTLFNRTKFAQYVGEVPEETQP